MRMSEFAKGGRHTIGYLHETGALARQITVIQLDNTPLGHHLNLEQTQLPEQTTGLFGMVG